MFYNHSTSYLYEILRLIVSTDNGDHISLIREIESRDIE